MQDRFLKRKRKHAGPSSSHPSKWTKQPDMGQRTSEKNIFTRSHIPSLDEDELLVYPKQSNCIAASEPHLPLCTGVWAVKVHTWLQLSHWSGIQNPGEKMSMCGVARCCAGKYLNSHYKALTLSTLFFRNEVCHSITYFTKTKPPKEYFFQCSFVKIPAERNWDRPFTSLHQIWYC